MEGLGVLLVVVAAFIANLPALREQWRTDRAGSIKTIWLFGLYCPYVGLGIVVVQAEGAAVQTVLAADVLSRDILTALDLLIYPLRLVATLRS